MKIEPAELNPAFKPVSFTITCETKDELDAWGAILNHGDMTRFITGIGGAGFYTKMKEIGADVNRRFQELQNIKLK